MTGPLLTSFALVILTLGIGGWLTVIGPWYLNLDMPAWKPPNWAFGPVWTAIGVCAAMSAGLAWRAAPTWEARRLIWVLFAVNAVLNILWSVFFFRLRRPDWALIEVALLWLSVAALIVALRPIHELSAWLLAPYLLWVTIATTLNASVVRRNAPFGAAYVSKSTLNAH